jgi:predicted MFS family arabinose efflux permease
LKAAATASAKTEAQANLVAVILAAGAIAAIGMGMRQLVGLYMKPMTQDLGLTRETFALAVAIANIVWGIAAPFAGFVADRFGAGRVVVMGGLATASGLALMSAATNEVQLLFSGVLMGLGVAGAGVNSLMGTVGRLVGPDNRTRAIAAIGMGSGIGILIALPYAHLLIDALRWKKSLLVLAATSLLIIPLAKPVSGRPPQTPHHARLGAAGALREAIAHRDFWLLNFGFFVCGFHVVFYATHLPAYVADQGIEPWIAVISLTIVGIGNLIGTWLAGEWGRRFPKQNGLALIYGARSGVFLLFLILPPSPGLVLFASAALGLLWLSTVPLTSGLVASFFGPQWMTMLYGIVFFTHQVGSFMGVWLAGRLFDEFGSYDAMWWICVAIGLFAALINMPIREPSQTRPVEQRA